MIIKRTFINEFAKDFLRGFLSREKYLEIKLQEICSGCPLNRDLSEDEAMQSVDSKVIDEYRMEYFGLLLQSFIGKAGDDETELLFSYLKKCEECLHSHTNNFPELQESGTRSD